MLGELKRLALSVEPRCQGDLNFACHDDLQPRSMCVVLLSKTCNEIDDAAPRQWTSGSASGYRALEFLAVATVKMFQVQQGRPSRNKQVPFRWVIVLRGANVRERQPERVVSDE
jgi:hypothetical protein